MISTTQAYTAPTYGQWRTQRNSEIAEFLVNTLRPGPRTAADMGDLARAAGFDLFDIGSAAARTAAGVVLGGGMWQLASPKPGAPALAAATAPAPKSTAEAVEDPAYKAVADRERERCKQIIMSEEARGREDLALELATKTNVSVDAAKAALRNSARAGGDEVVLDVGRHLPSAYATSENRPQEVSAYDTIRGALAQYGGSSGLTTVEPGARFDQYRGADARPVLDVERYLNRPASQRADADAVHAAYRGGGEHVRLDLMKHLPPAYHKTDADQA